MGSKPQLILIAGCTGTGKSTFGMSIALSQSILKCVSTDTIREVTRTQTLTEPKPAELMRSSYEGDGDPVVNWTESCKCLDLGINGLVDDALKRGTSLVLEGVHIQPTNELIDRWRAGGGIAIGCLLMIRDAESHRSLIFKRGEVTKKGEEKKMKSFERIRKIQDAMFKMAVANDWLLVEQKIEPDPIDIVTSLLAEQNAPDLK
jgi:2-phosphoglycerate kinase